MKNLITDIPGLKVGNSDDSRVATGVTAIVFDEPAVASIAILGGAPGVRDTAMLEPEMTVGAVDAILLSGGSAFGLDAAGGAMAALREKGRGFQVRSVRVPIVPQAILFDLLNGGDKEWGKHSPYPELGYQAVMNASSDFRLGTSGAGFLGGTLRTKRRIWWLRAPAPIPRRCSKAAPQRRTKREHRHRLNRHRCRPHQDRVQALGAFSP